MVKNPQVNAGDTRDEGSTLGPRRCPEKEMANHSSTLAWEIPWTEKLGRLYSPWSHRNQTRLSMYTHMNTRGVPKEDAKIQSYSGRWLLGREAQIIPLRAGNIQ